ncbi:MAG: hypothetical protein ACLR7Z_18600 [Bilophila wadsworthia]
MGGRAVHVLFAEQAGGVVSQPMARSPLPLRQRCSYHAERSRPRRNHSAAQMA